MVGLARLRLKDISAAGNGMQVNCTGVSTRFRVDTSSGGLNGR